jgi:hypothetical protein
VCKLDAFQYSARLFLLNSKKKKKERSSIKAIVKKGAGRLT